MPVWDAELVRRFARNSALMKEKYIVLDQITAYIVETVMKTVRLKQSMFLMMQVKHMTSTLDNTQEVRRN
jgi:hypothetical protein